MFKLFSAVTTLSLIAAYATPAFGRDDQQLWTTASANVQLGGKWRLSQEVVARLSDRRNGLYEVESNTLVGYRLSDSVTLWGGYTHNPQYLAGDFRTMERRAREQLTIDNFAPLGPGRLSARIRGEQRWREGVDGTGWRVRPFLRYALPIGNGGKTTLNLSSEPFFNLNTTAFQSTKGLDRMRNAAGLSTKLSKTVAVELGYLNQHGFVRNGEDTSDHVAQLGLSTNF